MPKTFGDEEAFFHDARKITHFLGGVLVILDEAECLIINLEAIVQIVLHIILHVVEVGIRRAVTVHLAKDVLDLLAAVGVEVFIPLNGHALFVAQFFVVSLWNKEFVRDGWDGCGQLCAEYCLSLPQGALKTLCSLFVKGKAVAFLLCHKPLHVMLQADGV